MGYGYRNTEDEWQIMVTSGSLDRKKTGKNVPEDGSTDEVEWIWQDGALARCNTEGADCGDYEE